MIRELDIRSLENNKVLKKKKGDNKTLVRENYVYKQLFEIYKNSDIDFPPDILTINDLFKYKVNKVVSPIKTIGEIVNVPGYASLVRPDFKYKLGMKTLLVNRNITDDLKDKSKIFVLQDCTLSMQKYDEKLKILKGYILDKALKNDYEIHWLFIAEGIVDRKIYTRKSIEDMPVEIVYKDLSVNIPNILIDNEFIGQQVLLITDGTDDFKFNLNTKASKIDLIIFNENIWLKEKMTRYGKVRYFL